jgi:hypothetical protein
VLVFILADVLRVIFAILGAVLHVLAAHSVVDVAIV